MKIFLETTDGIFDLNDDEDYKNMLTSIDDCTKFTDGELDTFMYNPYKEVIDE